MAPLVAILVSWGELREKEREGEEREGEMREGRKKANTVEIACAVRWHKVEK
jgi:hypothetical protein